MSTQPAGGMRKGRSKAHRCGPWAAAWMSAAVTLSAVSTAEASEVYPEHIQQLLGMECRPTCTLCHLTPSGGPGNRNEGGFLKAMLHFGLTPGGNTESVTTAIEAWEAELAAKGVEGFTRDVGVSPDSDGDGIGDIDQLRQSRHLLPNPPDVTEFCDVENVDYGCFARVARRGELGSGGAVVSAWVLALGALARRRRRLQSGSALQRRSHQ